jgi:hypothetical protein
MTAAAVQVRSGWPLPNSFAVQRLSGARVRCKKIVSHVSDLESVGRTPARRQGLAELVAQLRVQDLTDDEIAKLLEIHQDFRPKVEKALSELQGLLTDDQNKARQEG